MTHLLLFLCEFDKTMQQVIETAEEESSSQPTPTLIIDDIIKTYIDRLIAHRYVCLTTTSGQSKKKA